MKFHEVNSEVLYTLEPIVNIGHGDIDLLKERARSNQRRRARICMHPDVHDRLHEMLIVHASDAYVRPHLHNHKSESLHIVEGRAELLFFSSSGEVKKVISMGSCSSGALF